VLSVLSVCILFAVLERESEETKEAESSVAALRRQVASQREAIAALDADIEQYRARVANLRKGQFLLTSIISRTRRPLDPIRARNGTENVDQACNTYLCRVACLRACFGLRH
jgi:predicted RNase H-like nuclease (RuvC/YqgF family)